MLRVVGREVGGGRAVSGGGLEDEGDLKVEMTDFVTVCLAESMFAFEREPVIVTSLWVFECGRGFFSDFMGGLGGWSCLSTVVEGISRF